MTSGRSGRGRRALAKGVELGSTTQVCQNHPNVQGVCCIRVGNGRMEEGKKSEGGSDVQTDGRGSESWMGTLWGKV